MATVETLRRSTHGFNGCQPRRTQGFNGCQPPQSPSAVANRQGLVAHKYRAFKSLIFLKKMGDKLEMEREVVFGRDGGVGWLESERGWVEGDG